MADSFLKSRKGVFRLFVGVRDKGRSSHRLKASGGEREKRERDRWGPRHASWCFSSVFIVRASLEM